MRNADADRAGGSAEPVFLGRKLMRDLWGMKGQALAISMVIVSGVATYVISVSTLDSLRETRAAFYRDYRFAELFVSLKRAPESAAETVRAIPGVDRVETRVAAWANIDVPGFPEPVRGLMVSVPDAGALFRIGDRFAVFVVEKGRAKARTVEIGRRSGLAAQLLSGLAEGETVILHPGDTVADGKKVRPR
jgi:hypothetical protein